jgi:polysaccharide export outer membrane protein
MKPERLLILAIFLPSLVCYSQNTQPAAAPAQAAAPAPAAPDTAAGTASSSYVIGPSDVLTITVWKEPTLSGNILVRPDGMVTVPLVGD